MGAGGRRGTHPLAMPNSQNDARNRWLTPFSCGLGAARRGAGWAWLAEAVQSVNL